MIDDTTHQSYDHTFFQYLFDVEDKHFWFRSRNRIISALVQRFTAKHIGKCRVLEVGCGTGNVLRNLKEIYPSSLIVGMDLFFEGLRFARSRTSANLVQGDLGRPPFINQFDVIGLFDVLEHLQFDRQVLQDLKEMLREDGFLILTVPAHPTLWSYFDEASHHCRRYQPDQLRQKLIEAGYDIEYISQFMMAIFPIVWLGRRLSALRRRLFGGHSEKSVGKMAIQDLRPIPVINEALSCLLSIEEWWLAKGNSLPLGTSLLVVARKRQGDW
jgi:SAM-dependent methyltransferase